ncbi:hypothetical protein BZ21_3130 [Yersinia pseudotuberculosis]|uniref:immunity protein Tsi6 family protein n=2 Tax=Yersinia pseudotuberculosis TaxID=633 RepID=UPI000173990E|nr:immunity protein Tsi6 family protein [Yersinia pseudotuberculosis]AJJ03690.1 hypothetical protein BZ21_3130 [Yersinia pseudotuberculosis]AJJ66574.1 hypothetical protein BZ16_3243 [Yersinia pseudotuberculosis PB1/+]PSH21112.1 hypothetical protein BLA52_01390 [Yersinia pseudotuberculosis]PSH27237.1 hypothetical protein BLA50_04740 [Yersinia pseudotuberculosis]PSH30785.1 hypothetical protein BLA51_09415 [Yersinia pseudotuberculosis]
MTNDTALDYVDRALRLAQKRHHHIQYNVIGGKTLEPMYNSIVQQLIYLHNVITGEEKDKSRIHKMTMGMYAAKEFDVMDPIFADRISSALFIVKHIGNGLKVRLPHEIEPDYYDEQKKLKAAYPDDFDV